MTIKRIALLLATTAAIVAAPGIAQAVPGDPGQCTGTGYCQVEPSDNGILDGAGVVAPKPSAWYEFRTIAGHALADFLFGPQW